MKKTSFVGLVCAASIVITLVVGQPTLATEPPATIRTTNPGSSQTSTIPKQSQSAPVVQAATRKPRSNSPLEILGGVFAVSLAAVAVIFKQRMGNWTVKQVFKLQKYFDR